MTPERWNRVKEIMVAAWERGIGERDVFLDNVCAGDPELRAHVDALLTADRREGGLMDRHADLAAAAAGELMRAALDSAPDDTSEPNSKLVGARLGRYLVKASIGKGGMGAV